VELHDRFHQEIVISDLDLSALHGGLRAPPPAMCCSHTAPRDSANCTWVGAKHGSVGAGAGNGPGYPTDAGGAIVGRGVGFRGFRVRDAMTGAF